MERLASLRDGFRRIHDDLRVSVTDRCNLRCSYCMPEEPQWFPRGEILAFEEILRVVRLLVRAGIRHVRVTGGEPLVRRDLPRLIRMLSTIPGLEDLSLTTNGLLLAGAARALAAAGLRRVNVSLDTLREDRFRHLTGMDGLDRVLSGLEAAKEAGLSPVKVNAVLVRGVNDDEAEALAAAGRSAGWEIRFIEFMPLENGDTWDPSRVVTGDEVRRRIEAVWPLRPDPKADPRAAAARMIYRDGRGAVGFVNSVTQPFCGDCSRLRLTADGKLRVCLYDPGERDLKPLLRSGAGDGQVERVVREALAGKGRGGALEIRDRRARLPLSRTMHQIGG